MIRNAHTFFSSTLLTIAAITLLSLGAPVWLLTIGTFRTTDLIVDDTAAIGTYLNFGNGTASPISSAGAARIIYNNTTHSLQTSVNGGAYASLNSLAIGELVGSSTANEVLFVDSSNELGESSHFVYQEVGPVNSAPHLQVGPVPAGEGHSLDVVSNYSADVPAFFWSTAIDGYAGIGVDNYLSTFEGGFGFGNPSVGLGSAAGKLFVDSNGAPLCLLDVPNDECAEIFYFGGDTNYGMQMRDGSSSAQADPATMRLRYNRFSATPAGSVGAFEVSLNGANYSNVVVDTPTTGPAFISCGGSTSFTGTARKAKILIGTSTGPVTTCEFDLGYTVRSCNVTARSGIPITYSTSTTTVSFSAVASSDIEGLVFDYDCN